MPVFNVKVEVVELVRADNGQSSIAKLERALRTAGFEPFCGGSEAFESEPLPDGTAVMD